MVAAWVIALLVACSDGPLGLSPAIRLDGYIPVPLFTDRVDNLYVRAQVEGAEVTLLVDTGASNTFLDLNTAKKLGLKLKPTDASINVDGVKHPTQLAEVSSFRIGEVIRRNPTPVGTHDMSKFVAHTKEKHGVELHGILGSNFLKGYSAIIDYRRGLLYLGDPMAWELRLVQGTWKGVGCEYCGDKVTDKDYISKAKLKITGDRIEFEHDGLVYDGTLHLDCTRNPKQYAITDLIRNGKPYPGAVLGLYKLDKQRLHIMMPIKKAYNRPEDLPMNLATSVENGMGLFTFETAEKPDPFRPLPKSRRDDK